MNTVRNWMVAALCGLLSWSAASAQQADVAVRDSLNFFSQGAKDQANQRAAEIKRLYQKTLFIETTKAPPQPKDLDVADAIAVNKFFDEWAAKRYQELGINGVYVVIVDNPAKIRIEVGQQTQAKNFFTQANRTLLSDKIKEKLKANDKDGALVVAANFVADTMKHNHPDAVPQKGSAPVAHNNPAPVQHNVAPGGGFQMGGILTIVAILVVVWVVFAIIRGLIGMMSGGGGGGHGYGPGYGGGGGGGGGFMTSMLGGMFGAAAGMWLYSQFSGGSHHNSAWANDNPGGDKPTAGDPNAGDDVATGGGDDYAGGGDAGAGGGGDWGGGGGDAGGGGDWGGGGGGGGDWGGGGGGGGDW